jgi:UDP-N-acetylglucosamine--N-acetylmuramyl-(pentapeptide) pyrophosphoryl-undecaprenol N-acetylglucosamine transferase
VSEAAPKSPADEPARAAPLRVVIAGGGTGGHLFPGVAVAEELRARDPEAAITFVGTERGIEARVLPELGWPLELISVSGLKTMGLRGLLRGLVRLPRALWQARRILRRLRPQVVIGVGGYASGPLVLMARLSRIPSAILEQNSIPGLTNKILGKLVPAVFLSFDEARRFFADKRVRLTGNPIRAPIRAALAEAADHDGDAAARRPRLLIVGGSQGAVALNAIVAGAMAELKARGITPEIVHQTGERSLEETRARYVEAGIEAECLPFIRDMAAAYRRADLVIARAGATTVAELGVVGKPAIFVPFPYAADNHQEINSREVVRAGAARMYRQAELEPTQLADAIAEITGDPSMLSSMADAMKRLGRPDAAAEIADWCLTSSMRR